ncbi:MAG: DUF1080 domain-containing protein [Verrucomicrobia bacterium]|nr:MAG: DUF1080 domain-containing protein [Verrucomicrobiota bacterium]
MKFYPTLFVLSLAFTLKGAPADGPVFYGDPPDDHHPWAVHDRNRPQPKVVTPGTSSTQEQPGTPPSDAVVLFGGAESDLAKWQSANERGGPAKWNVKDGNLVVEPKSGDIRTKEEFGDCQVHVEWTEPKDVSGSSQGRGNSGVFLMGIVEIQVLDSFNNWTYADGGAGSVYGQHEPMANPLRPPGQWQFYDIIFRRPIYRNGELIDPGYVTVFVNGVAAQDHAVLEGPTGHMKRSQAGPFPEKGPLRLQDHGNPVSFRNIWYRPLPPRPSEGGTDGWLSSEATMAKRKQIAGELRQGDFQDTDQGRLQQLLRYAEALEYDKDDASIQQVESMATRYVDGLKALQTDQLTLKKEEAKQVHRALDFLAKNNVLPESFAPKKELDQIAKEHHWDK